MGFRLCWMAVKGKAPEDVRNELSLRPTGQRLEFPDSKIAAAELPDGWYLIVWDRDVPDKYLDDISGVALKHISVPDCELVTCFVHEGIMISSAAFWKDGHKVWSIIHDSTQGSENLITEGDLPEGYAQIRDKALSEQRATKGVDHVFDVPLDIAQSITGYSHCQDLPGVETAEPFEELVADPSPSAVTPKRTFWKKLFGS